jgi:hypothetical protein
MEGFTGVVVRKSSFVSTSKDFRRDAAFGGVQAINWIVMVRERVRWQAYAALSPDNFSLSQELARVTSEIPRLSACSSSRA